MPINVNGTELIQDDGTVVNFTDLSGEYSTLHANYTVLPNPDPAVPDNVIDCNYSLHYLTPAVNNYPYQFSNQTMGDIITVVLDRGADGTSGNDPVFNEYSHAGGSSGYTMWSSAGTPNWSAHRYWMLTFFAVGFGSNLLMRGVSVGYDEPSAPGDPLPTSKSDITQYPRQTADAGLLASGSVTETDNSGGSVAATASFRISLLWDPAGTGSLARIQWFGQAGASWLLYNYTGGADNIQEPQGAYPIWSNVVSPDAVRIVSGPTSNPTQNDTGWTTTTGVGQGVTVTMTSSASSAGGSGTVSSSKTTRVALWVRATNPNPPYQQYDDTLVATFDVFTSATATSNCFTGDSKLAIIKPDGSTSLVFMEEAYEAWQAMQAANEYAETPQEVNVLGNDGYINKILEFRKRTQRMNLYGFNGASNFVTGGHPFLTTEGWKCADVEIGRGLRPELNVTQLEVGDVLIKYNFITKEYYHEEITSMTNEFRAVSVYSLDVEGPDSGTEGNDTYIVNGYVVHNK